MGREMEKDLLAAIEGAFEGGATEILVADSHSVGMNVSPNSLPDRVRLVRGYPRTYYMMAGLDESFDVAFFVGYHAPAGYLHGQMDHTYSSFSIYEVRVNGEIFGESELNALYAGELGVPIGLITGDKALFEFSSPKFPETTRFVVTKEGMSRFSALLYPVQEVRAEIRRKAEDAAKNAGSLELFRRRPENGEYVVELTLLDTVRADLASIMPGMERVDGRTVRYHAKSASEVMRVVHATAIMGAYARYLTG